MTATARLVKMAACPPIDGDGVDSENFVSTSSLQASKLLSNNSQIKSSSSRGNSKVISLDGEKAYDTVASLEESELRNLLEEVINPKQNKNDKSAIAQFLIRKEEDALREESGSGEDTIELALGRQKKKRSNYRKEHCEASQLGSSAAARNNTGGSLGSLHNLSDPKVPEQTNTNTQGVASRSRAGGSCGNLSKGSFETHACRRKSRRSRDLNRASTSQREGGSLQNLSKTEAASHEAKKLHKSGSLSQVFSDVGGVRIKNRRQKTSSESSTRTYCRRSEDREAAGESSEEEIGEYPYQRLIPSHSSGSGHSCDPGETSVVGMVGGRWNGDHMSDVASGETTEEDGESMHIAARAKLGDTSVSRHHNSDGSDTELHSVISHTAHRDVLPTISSDSEVDKNINFCLSKNQDESMTTTNQATVLSYATAPCLKSVFDGKISPKDDEASEKRKLRSTKSENGSYEKSSLDENGNPVTLMAVRSTVSSGSSISTSSTGASIFSQVACNDRHSSSLTIGRRNGFSTQTKDISMYNKIKAKQEKRREKKDKGVIPIELTPGFRGDEPLHAILKFLGAEDSSNPRSKKKSKGKKEEDKDGVRNRKAKSFDKSSNEDINSDKTDNLTIENFGSGKGKNDESSSGSDTKERRDDDGKKNKRNQEKRRAKKGSGLRESSSVEDLVSKSKQIDNVKEVRKQVTVDDGGLSPFHHGNPKSEYCFENSVKSEFSYDFYKVGDALLEPISNESGDFEVVGRKKGKKARNASTVSQGVKNGGSGGWTNGSGMYGGFTNSSEASGGWTNNSYSATSEDYKRTNFLSRSNPRYSSKVSSQDKPQINFSEGPFTVHDGVFLSQFSGSRSSNSERYTTTTSVPHSEDSDSDGGDSVHSMPAHVITPRPHVRKPPPSTDSTPQASYANIAKLAASANKAQMKRVAMANHVGTLLNASEEDGDRQNPIEEALHNEPKAELGNSILDDNFPPLTGGVSSSATGAITTTITNNNDNNNSSISESNSVINVANQGLSLPQDSISVVKKDTKVVYYSNPSSDSCLCENSLKTSNLSNITSNNNNNNNSNNNNNNNNNNTSNISCSGTSLLLSEHITPTSKVSTFSTSSVSSSVCSQNFTLSQQLHTTTTLSSVDKPVVPHTQMTTIYNTTTLAQKIPNHIPALEYVNQNMKSNTGTKVGSNMNIVQQKGNSGLPCTISSINSSLKDTNDKLKNSVPKETKPSNSRQTKPRETLENGSKNKRFEAAVVFMDNAKFDLSNFEIEFGFGLTFDNISNLTDVSASDSTSGVNSEKLLGNKPISTVNNNNNKEIKVYSTIDYSKLYQAPRNDVISYNYEELCRHVCKGWESTLRMMEEDPKNIQFWKATENASNN